MAIHSAYLRRDVWIDDGRRCSLPALISCGVVLDANTNESFAEWLERCHFELIDRVRLEMMFVVILVLEANIFGRLISIVEQLDVNGSGRARFDVLACVKEERRCGPHGVADVPVFVCMVKLRSTLLDFSRKRRGETGQCEWWPYCCWID